MALAPDSRLAQRVLPGPLYRALAHVYAQGISGCMLVGGTAISGYYAGHRRSDDLDLFARDEDAYRATVLAARSLTDAGAQVEEVFGSAQYFKASCLVEGHRFTVDVVLDANLHAVGEFHVADDGVAVAGVETLLRQKAATLVSRCGEKDLYDLIWLFRANPGVGLSQLIDLGSQIDAGLTAEAALASLLGSELSSSSCGFSLTQTPDEVLRDIAVLKRNLEASLDELARNQPAPGIGRLVRALRPRNRGNPR